MITTHHRNCGQRGQSLAETLGVLGVIAFLACLLAPKIVGLVSDARLTADVQTYQNLRSASQAYFQRYLKFAGPNGTAITVWTNNAYEFWDRNVLLAGRFLDKVPDLKAGTNAYVRLVKVTATSSSTQVLTDPGQIGHLPDSNVNNGYYNLTQEYADNFSTDPNGPLYARLAPPHGTSFPGLDTLALLSPGQAACQTAIVALRGLAPHLRGMSLPGLNPHSRLVQAAGWLVQLSRLTPGQGRSPLQCCYPVPTTWTPPPGAIGTPSDSNGGSPSHSNPSVTDQILAPSSTTPAIVAELVIEGISVQDAYRLSLAIDGYSQSNWAFFDSLGRVKYDMYNGSGGTKTGVVFIYLGHK